MRSFTVNSVEDCQKQCVEDKACQAFNFVSGWNRCFIKARLGKTFKVSLSSGTVLTSASGSRQVGEIKSHFDLKARDLRKLETKTVDACAQNCLVSEDCFAFTFIDGYKICWLKEKQKAWIPKTFYCGTK